MSIQEERSFRRETESDSLLAPWISDILQLHIKQGYSKYSNTQLWHGPEAQGEDNYKITKALVKEEDWEKEIIQKKQKIPHIQNKSTNKNSKHLKESNSKEVKSTIKLWI